MQNANIKKIEIKNVKNLRVGIVQAQFNADITDAILQDAESCLKKYGIKNNTDVFTVFGSVEIPTILKAMADSKKYDLLIAIGAIIKGETDHYHFVAKLVCEGVLQVMLANKIPIGFAVLTTANKELAQKRISIGSEAVEAALNNASLLKTIQ
ncbi:MAG: 6,7-dimethyl-8-ribityllumazine synthase [bacterium]